MSQSQTPLSGTSNLETKYENFLEKQWNFFKGTPPASFKNWPFWNLPTCRKWLKYPKPNNSIPDSSLLWSDPAVWACVSHYVWPYHGETAMPLRPQGHEEEEGKHLRTKLVVWQIQDCDWWLKSWAWKPRRKGVLPNVLQMKRAQSQVPSAFPSHSGLHLHLISPLPECSSLSFCSAGPW